MRAGRQLWVVLGLLFGAGVQAAELPFDVVKVESQTVAREEVFDAVLEAVHQSTVSAQTSGRITEVYFDVDDYVEKDTVLMRFRDREQRAALEAAQARYAEASANFERIKDIYSQKLVSKAEYDRAEAALRAARAALDQAQEQLAYTEVRAPYAGIVVERHVEPGETANPGQPLMTGLSLESLRAIASIPQQHIAAVRGMQRARVIFIHGDGESVEAEKLTFSPYADEVSHTFNVRIELPEGQHNVYPGMFVKAAFVTGEYQRIVVPSAAVVHRSEVTAVYVVKEDGAVQLRHIRAGRELPGGMVEVLAGLNEGEEVAVDPIAAGIYLKESRAQ